MPTDAHLSPTAFIDAGHPSIAALAADVTHGLVDDRSKAVALYYRIRDDIRYEVYRISLAPDDMKASATLGRGDGFCVAKSVLLAAAARAAGIPARLGFADVRNHLSTKKLLDALGTDLFIWHGYTDLFIDGTWVKATPAFNVALCEKFGVKPLEFDGVEDSVFHEFDASGRRHMEYVNDRGTYDDLPLDQLVAGFAAVYPGWSAANGTIEGDFGADAATERASTN